jgi:2-haloalkanoic acid dehalogenase type II
MESCPKLVTFDCYGTLIDWYGGLQAALRSLGLSEEAVAVLPERYVIQEAEVESGPYRPYREVMREALRRTLGEAGRPLPPEDADLLARALPGWEPFPEVPEVLRDLATRAPLAILSNIDDDLLEASITRLGVPIRFRITAEGTRSYKPAPDHFRRIQEVSGLPAGDILHVAASLMHDQEPCRRLDIPSIWINRRGEDRPGWLPPERVLPDLRGLRELAFPTSG